MKKGLFFVVVGIILFVGFGLYLQGMETRDEKEVDAYFLKFDKESKPIEITPEGFRLSNFFNDVIREHSEDFIKEFADTLTGETKKKAEIYISEYLKVFGRKRKMKEEDLKTFVKLLDALAKKPDDLKQLIEDLEIEELITQIWMADCFGVEAFLDKLLAQYAKKIKPKIKKEDYCNFFLSKQSIFSKIEEDLPPDVVKYSLPQKLFYGYDVIEFVEPIKTGSDVRRMVVLPNGNFISGHEDGTIRIWNSKTGEQIGKTIKTDFWVNSIVALPNKNFISSYVDRTIRIWNSKTGEQIGKPIKIGSLVDSMVVLPNGNFISGHEDGTIQIWNLNLYKGLTFKEAVLLRLLMKRRKEGIQIQSKVKESAKYKEASLGLSKKKIFQSFFGEIDTEDFDDDDEKEVQMEEDEEIVFES